MSLSSSKLSSNAPAYMPTSLNEFGQPYMMNTNCIKPSEMSDITRFLSMAVNCTPHAINYFKTTGTCSAEPVFRLEKMPDDFVWPFRPHTREDLLDIPALKGIDVYNTSTYLQVREEPERMTALVEFFAWTAGYEVILIMSPISAQNIAYAIDKGHISADGVTILTPNSGKSVRDDHGNMIGVTAFTAIWNDGIKIDRAK